MLNGALVERDLEVAIREQKNQALNRALEIPLRTVLDGPAMERVMRRHRETDESLLEAVTGLELLSQEFVEGLIQKENDFRRPLGQILVDLRLLDQATFDYWLHRFETQEFDLDVVARTLKQSPLFERMTHEALREIAGKLHYKVYGSGDIVYKEGTRHENLYFVESGLVRLSVASSTRELELYRLQSGDYCGLYGLLADGPAVERATAILDSSIWTLRKHDVLDLLQKDHGFAATAALHVSKNIHGMLRGMKGTSSRIQTNNINSILFGDDVYSFELATTLVEEIWNECRGPVLLIKADSNPAWPEMQPVDVTSVEHSKPVVLFERGKQSIHCLHWPEIQNTLDLERLSFWLRNESQKYASVVFMVYGGTIDSGPELEFLKFVLGVSRRTATLVKEKIPSHAPHTRPGRDRVYLIESDSDQQNLRLYRDLKRHCYVALAPVLFKMDTIKKSCARIAQYLVGHTVGLALGGGGARGMAHIGVLEVLEENGIAIDAVSGSSAGAMMGAALAAGSNVADMKDYLIKNVINAKPFNDWTFPVKSLSRGKRGRRLIRDYFGDANTFHSKIPYLPVGTRMDNGREIILKGISYVEAIMASGAGPGLLPPADYDGMHILDGGLVDNVPAAALKDFGIDFVISVNISVTPEKAPYDASNILGIIPRFIDIVMDQTITRHLEYTDLDIEPEVDIFTVFDWPRGPELIEIGREATRRKLPELKYLLENARRPR